MKTSESIKTISPALLKAQQTIGAVFKGAQNPFFKSAYADLPSVIEAVKGPLNDVGIAFIQSVDCTEHGPVVETRLLHESGEWIASVTPIFCKENNNPQALGSGITYSKRYALQAICGVPTSDDDGEGAMGRDQKETTNPPLNQDGIKSADGRKYVSGFFSPKAAINKLMMTRTLTEADKVLVEDIWYAERGENENS
jgi:hypothetical protein